MIERETEAGGIPRHCDHTGFGVRDLRRVISGPRYAERYRELAQEAGAELLTETMVTGFDEGRLKLTGPPERREVEAAGGRARHRMPRAAPLRPPGARLAPRRA